MEVFVNPFIFPPSECKHESIKVVDGDTFHCDVKIWSHDGVSVYLNQTIRLHRVDASEKSTVNGLLMKDVMKMILASANNVFVEGVKKDPYGRVIAEVFLNDNTINLSDYLLEKKVVVLASKRQQRTLEEDRNEYVNIQKLFNELRELSSSRYITQH